MHAITLRFSGTDLMIINRTMDLKDSSPLDNPHQNCNDCNDKQDVYQASGMECEKSQCPCNYQYYRDYIKYISHDSFYLIFTKERSTE